MNDLDYIKNKNGNKSMYLYIIIKNISKVQY